MSNDLRQLASRATPGPWKHDDIDAFEEFPSEWDATIDGPSGGLLVMVPTGVVQEENDHYNERTCAAARDSQGFRDAAYIAAASPDVILALLDARDECERQFQEKVAALLEVEHRAEQAESAVERLRVGAAGRQSDRFDDAGPPATGPP